MKSVPAMYGQVMFNEAAFNGSVDRENPLFTQLKTIFDLDDAEHIFQAHKRNMDYFLTLDKKTIINRAVLNKDKLQQTGISLKFVLPTELGKELALMQGKE